MPQDISGETDTVHLTALGVPVVLRASGGRSSELVQAFSAAWEWCLNGVPREHSLPGTVIIEAFLDKGDQAVQDARGRGLTASTSLTDLMHWLTPHVTTQVITARAGELLMLHACVLADSARDTAVVLVGPSGAGKTTVARTLGRRFGYVTDECAGITDRHAVVPFPKPLSLVTGHERGVKDQAPPTSLGLVAPPPSPRIVAVLYLDRDEAGPVEPSFATVSHVQALGLLCPQVSFVGSRPKPLQRIVALLDASGGLRRVSYREAWDLGPVVERLLDGAA